MQKRNVWLYVEKRGYIVKTKRKGKDSRESSCFSTLIIVMDVGDSSFLGILYSQNSIPNIRILDEQEFNILGTIQGMNQFSASLPQITQVLLLTLPHLSNLSSVLILSLRTTQKIKLHLGV